MWWSHIVSCRMSFLKTHDPKFRSMTRENYDAFTAMRNDINEMFGDMISSEATLKDGPEMSAECAAVVASLSAIAAKMMRMQNQIRRLQWEMVAR